MKPFLPRLVSVCLTPLVAVLCFALSASAQTAATGTIEGRVTHLRSGDPVELARVTVEGTALETFTDSRGQFRLSSVPSGEARVRIFFTGQDQQIATVPVSSSATARRDFTLTTAAASSASAPGTTAGPLVKLDQFVVSTSKEMDAAALAINEQRFASSIKSVVAADEFGSVLESNPGDFLKYIPGIRSISSAEPRGRSRSVACRPNTSPSPSAASMSPASPAVAPHAASISTPSR
jgi:hypothetical protein